MKQVKKELRSAGLRVNPDSFEIYEADSELVMGLSADFEAGYTQTVRTTEIM